MLNRSISLDCILAWTLWAGGIAIALGDWFSYMPEDSGFVGIALIAAGHLVSTFAAQRRRESLERNLFEMGRDSVRPLR